ncbi:MAG: glutamate synthase subunit beta [Proteobacteria bacterium]|nr:glutamate synthase subunit beta [Pseudomonadota bacterium]
MPNERGFLEIERRDPGYRPTEERLTDYKAVEQMFTDEEVCQQAARCMNCGIPFCHSVGCPLGNVAPEFNTYVTNRQWKSALEILVMTNCFPEFTGRICPALCEASCVLSINDDPVAIRQIELNIIEKGFEEGYIAPNPPASRLGLSVAVIGTGPAGLAAANILNQRGYKVVAYENGESPGGILRYGIPDFKLEKWVLDRRLQLMRAEGVKFETGVEAGVDLSYRYLQKRFDAVLLTGGAREPRDLKVPGRDLDGVHFAMDYLIQQNKRIAGESLDHQRELTAKNKRVVVLGGGDTGSDCLGTALRQGAKQVHQFEIMPRPPDTRSDTTPWPMWPLVLQESSSHKEGGERRWSMATTDFFGADDRVTKLKCVEVDWVVPKGGQHPAPEERRGTEFEVDAELVLLALGFIGPGKSPLVDELHLDLDPRGFIRCDDNNMTSRAGVFAAGDMTMGATLVVHAIRDGMNAAHNVMSYLQR